MVEAFIPGFCLAGIKTFILANIFVMKLNGFGKLSRMNILRQKLSLIALIVVVLSASSPDKFCFAFPPPAQIRIEQFYRTELFFGRNMPDGLEVSEADFTAFLINTITPEFPDGLTVLDGIGQFRTADGKIVQERAKVLVLLYLSKTRRQTDRKIERIRTAYKNQFKQESVLRVDSVLPVKVSF
jgi:hypothetical protein